MLGHYTDSVIRVSWRISIVMLTKSGMEMVHLFQSVYYSIFTIESSRWMYAAIISSRIIARVYCLVIIVFARVYIVPVICILYMY